MWCGVVWFGGVGWVVFVCICRNKTLSIVSVAVGAGMHSLGSGGCFGQIELSDTVNKRGGLDLDWGPGSGGAAAVACSVDVRVWSDD